MIAERLAADQLSGDCFITSVHEAYRQLTGEHLAWLRNDVLY
jgi:hypothetical protein